MTASVTTAVEDGLFLPLPVRGARALRVLGPTAANAPTSVDPLVRFDRPYGLIQSFMGGLCDATGNMQLPIEIMLAVDPALVPTGEAIPPRAILRAFCELPELYRTVVPARGVELTVALMGSGERSAPLLYCRKRNVIFAARSPATAEPLVGAPVSEDDSGDVPLIFTVWDGPADGRAPNLYSARGGNTELGPSRPYDELIVEQGLIITRVAEMLEIDPPRAAEIAAAHACVRCPERERCYPRGDSYAYVQDRLSAISVSAAPMIARPLGEWRLAEAASVLGGFPATAIDHKDSPANELSRFRQAQGQRIARGGPTLMLAGESEGRELLEIARLRLGLIHGVLEQLDSAWRASGRPHLIWDDDSVRIHWQPPIAGLAIGWGFTPLLRKIGLHPVHTERNCDDRILPYPPTFSDASLLPPEAVEAARYFGEERRANVFYKAGKAGPTSAEFQTVLLEDCGIPRTLFFPGDLVVVEGEGWIARLSPTGEHDLSDGDSAIALAGRATGNTSSLKAGESAGECRMRWYPRFGEAVDLHAVGMLLLEALVGTDQRNAGTLRDALLGEREELMRLCNAQPLEQRESAGNAWIIKRCTSDLPADIWSRRNLAYIASLRSGSRLGAFPIELWQSICTFALRLMTAIPGVSFCGHRGENAPRIGSGRLLPLVELTGLLALLDDQILRRTRPQTALRDAFNPQSARKPGA